MKRILRPVIGFENYLVGNDGTIWTLKRKGGNDVGKTRIGSPRKLKCHKNGSGYLVVSFDRNGKVYSRQVHRIVLENFVGMPTAGHQACHYPDATKTNNHVENLRWDTASENIRDKYRDKLHLQTKRCTTCNQTKNKTDYYKDARASDGCQSECKSCHMVLITKTRDPKKKLIANRRFMRRVRSVDPKRWRK